MKRSNIICSCLLAITLHRCSYQLNDGRGHSTVGLGALANQIASFPFCADFADVPNERGRLAECDWHCTFVSETVSHDYSDIFPIKIYAHIDTWWAHVRSR